MKRIVFGESIQGASHKRLNVERQDSKKIVHNEHLTIMTVADGHGSASCPYSRTGSSIAVNVFVTVMQDLLNGYAENDELLLTYLNREGETRIAQQIEAEWKRRVLKRHTDNKREVPMKDGKKDVEAIYKIYGTTLLGLVIFESFLFAFQLGDGDIVCIDSTGVMPIIEADKILGVETHSLSKKDAWKKAISAVRKIDFEEQLPVAFMISTDVFSNSYKSSNEFEKTCTNYYEMITEHGAKTVSTNLKDWLTETSELGCGDDITLLIAYFMS